MSFIMLSLLGLSVFCSHAASEPRPVKFLLLKGDRASYIDQAAKEVVTPEDSDEHLLAELRQPNRHTDDLEVNYEDFSRSHNTVAKASDSNARVFIRRFMRLKNLFGNKNPPIIIRVFLNASSVVPNIPLTPTVPTVPTNPTSPTGPVIPGTVSTIPTNPSSPTGPTNVPTVPTNPGSPTGPPTVPTVPTNPNLPTAKVGPIVPVVPNVPKVSRKTPKGPNTPSGQNDDIEYTENGSTSLQLPAHENYQSKVAKKNQPIIVRIPAKYRHLFKNGQQLKISTKNNVKRRRVPNKRGHKNRQMFNSNKSLKNKNRLTRIITDES